MSKVETLLVGRCIGRPMSFLFSRLRVQGQGRYKVRCEKLLDPMSQELQQI